MVRRSGCALWQGGAREESSEAAAAPGQCCWYSPTFCSPRRLRLALHEAGKQGLSVPQNTWQLHQGRSAAISERRTPAATRLLRAAGADLQAPTTDPDVNLQGSGANLVAMTG